MGLQTITIDGNNLYTTYGIKVEKIKGPMDFLKRKGETAYNWADSDGEEQFTDSTDIYYEPRDFHLFCYMEATSAAVFASQLAAFKTMLQAAGTRTLVLPYPTATSYTVYFKDGAAVDMLTCWNADKHVGRFILKLREPSPTTP